MTKKRAQTPQMTLIMITLLLGAIVFAVISTSIYTGVLRLSNRAEQSYDELAGHIASVNEDELISMPLYLDQETAIIAFDPGSNKLSFQTQTDGKIASSLLSKWTYVGTVDWISRQSGLGIPGVQGAVDWVTSKLFRISYVPEVIKPQECNSAEHAGKACVCLCQEFEVQELGSKIDIGVFDPKYICSKVYKCISPKSRDVKVKLSKNKHASVFLLDSGGYIFDRDLIMSGEDGHLKEAYIEKKGNTIHICDTYPCAHQTVIP